MARRRVEEPPPRRCGWCSSADWTDPRTGLLVPVYCECDGLLPVEPDPRDIVLREVDGGGA